MTFATGDCECIGIVVLLYSIYYIIERYIDPTRDYNRNRKLRLYLSNETSLLISLVTNGSNFFDPESDYKISPLSLES